MTNQTFVFEEINAFTFDGYPSIGNPATICVVDEFPTNDIMGQCAKTLGTAMTSFLKPTEDPYCFEIRHFSPDGNENHVCGHATLAASEHLSRLYPELRKGTDVTFRLNPKYAINEENAFFVHIEGRDIKLTIPAVIELERVDDPEFYKRLTDALGINEDDIVKPCYYAPRIINYVVEFKDETKLNEMSPDYAKLIDLATSDKFSHEGIMATTRSARSQFDIANRVFLPVIGVDEDLACGSANCSIIPYWSMLKDHAFPADQSDFNVIFPYPPRQDEGLCGGVQFIHLNKETEQVTITSQATYQKTHTLDASDLSLDDEDTPNSAPQILYPDQPKPL